MASQTKRSQRSLQAGVVPFRHHEGDLQFCVITTRVKTWGFPKGFIEAEETPQQAALKEAWEEAGLHGRLIGAPLGQFTYRKRDTDLVVTVFLMEVERSDEKWPEAKSRQRRWVSAAEAETMLEWEALRTLLRAAQSRLSTA